MPKLLTYASMLLIGGVFGFFIGRSTSTPPASPSNKAPQAVVEKEIPAEKTSLNQDKSLIAQNESSEDTSPAQDDSTSTPPPASMPSTANSSVKAVPTSLPVTNDCITEEKEWSFHLSLYAEQLEQQKIMYSQARPEELRDCSGIFFRMAQFAETKCSDYIYPDPTKTRDSRSIARWYHEQANLSLVKDPMKSRNLIRPGSVMFFGQPGKTYTDITIDKISGSNGVRGVINHVGVVTEVERDAQGNVISYVMMHGKRPGKVAARTYFHKVEPPRLGYPILGNWNEQWLAIGNIMTPKRAEQVIAQNDTKAGKSKQKEETPVSTSIPPSTPAITSLPTTQACVSGEQAWSKELTAFAEQLEGKKIMYTQSPPSALADCSGIFFRMIQFAQSKCGDYLYPDMNKTRDSRSIARWFHDNSNLVLVQDPMKTRNLIKPGSVMFFGRPGEKYSNLTIERMAGTPGARGAIFHVGVVTEVTKDEQGNVTGYVMMHGKSTGKAAGRTHYHKVEPPRIGYPILGSWNQQWVAIANIMTPKATTLASN